MCENEMNCKGMICDFEILKTNFEKICEIYLFIV